MTTVKSWASVKKTIRDDYQPSEGTFVYGSGSLWREGAGGRGRVEERRTKGTQPTWIFLDCNTRLSHSESVKQTTASQINDKISWRKEVWCVPMGKGFIVQAIWGSRALRLYRLVQGPTQDWINGTTVLLLLCLLTILEWHFFQAMLWSKRSG